MRKLKLEIQLSIDGFAADANGKMDWMVWEWKPEWNWDPALQRFHTELQTSSDTIILGKRMGSGDFLEHWRKVAANEKDPQYTFAKAIVDMKKYVFSKTLHSTSWENTEIIHGDLIEEVNKIKAQKGKDMIVYGGTSFVSSLIAEDLIDEYNFIINPTILGTGKPVFKKVASNKNLILTGSTAYDCGVVVMTYMRNK